ncbi:hypothetical protein [Mesorhizobium sp. M0491]|uniref:hypothetical protein n=1 Tax=Mesorhizobium sp. M0491 TaxID=2956950 RepID=UPI00333ADE3D
MLSMLRPPNPPRPRSLHAPIDQSAVAWAVIEIRLTHRGFDTLIHNARDGSSPNAKTAQLKARRTVRLGGSQMAIGFAEGDEPGSRLDVADDPRWRGRHRLLARCKAHRYGDHLRSGAQPRADESVADRNAGAVASWLEGHPGIEVIPPDCRGRRHGAPNATQVADRWHLLQNLGEALRLALGRDRKAVNTAGKAIRSRCRKRRQAVPET